MHKGHEVHLLAEKATELGNELVPQWHRNCGDRHLMWFRRAGRMKDRPVMRIQLHMLWF